MSAPGLLVDSDILILLSCSGLLDITINTLGFNRSSVFHLGTLPYRMRTDLSLKKLPENWKNAIRQECMSLPLFIGVPSAEALKLLKGVRNVDEGEDSLYVHVAENPFYLLASGDKKAMTAMAKSPLARPIRDAVAGRVICLEAVCIELVNAIGVHQVAQAFTPLFPINNSLKIYFGAVHVNGEESFRDAVSSYLRPLEAEVGSDFLWKRENIS